MSSKIEKSKNKFDNRNSSKTNINSVKRKISVKEAGITLVALVITIIVLLILAMISISSAVSGNGIFARAQKAGNLWRDAERSEDTSLNEISNKFGEYTDKIPDTPGEDKPTNPDEPNTTPEKPMDFYCRAFDTNNDGYIDTLVYSHSKDYNFTTDIIDTKYDGFSISTTNLDSKSITFNSNNAKFEFGYLSRQEKVFSTNFNGEVDNDGNSLDINDSSLSYYAYFKRQGNNGRMSYAIKNVIIYDYICLNNYDYVSFPSADNYGDISGVNIVGNGKIIINDITKIKGMFGYDTYFAIEQSWLDHLDIRDKNFYETLNRERSNYESDEEARTEIIYKFLHYIS